MWSYSIHLTSSGYPTRTLTQQGRQVMQVMQIMQGMQANMSGPSFVWREIHAFASVNAGVAPTDMMVMHKVVLLTPSSPQDVADAVLSIACKVRPNQEAATSMFLSEPFMEILSSWDKDTRLRATFSAFR